MAAFGSLVGCAKNPYRCEVRACDLSRRLPPLPVSLADDLCGITIQPGYGGGSGRVPLLRGQPTHGARVYVPPGDHAVPDVLHRLPAGDDGVSTVGHQVSAGHHDLPGADNGLPGGQHQLSAGNNSMPCGQHQLSAGHNSVPAGHDSMSDREH